MRKHLYIFIAIIMIGTSGLAYFGNSNAKNFEKPIASWEISGDEKLFEDVNFDFEVFGGKNNDYWSVSTSINKSDIMDYSYSTRNPEDIEKQLELNAKLNNYTNIYAQTLEDVTDYNDGWINLLEDKQGTKVQYTMTGTDAIELFYYKYIEQALDRNELSFQGEQIQLNHVMKNFRIKFTLDNEESFLSIPVTEEIMVTPQVTYSGEATVVVEKDVRTDYYASWDGKLLGLEGYCFDILQACVNGEEYAVVSFWNGSNFDDPFSFTQIYQLTESAGRTLLKAPKLVKNYDSYKNISYMGEINGTCIMMFEKDNAIKITTFDAESFEPIQSYIYVTNSYENVNRKGITEICESYQSMEETFYLGNILCFDNNHLYIATLYKKREDTEKNKQFVELVVLEPDKEEPLASAKLNCNLFQFESDYNYSFSYDFNKYCIYGMKITKTK